MSGAFVFPGGALDPGESPTEAAARELAEEAGIIIDPAQLQYFAHWLTPSVERKRFSARFFVGQLPAGQTPTIDRHEAIDMTWVTPAQGLAQSAELRLPPPQIRTLLELAPVCASTATLSDLCRARAEHPVAILPRAKQRAARRTLLLPWDPDYHTGGIGDELPVPADHPIATGPSRFVLTDQGWQHIAASEDS